MILTSINKKEALRYMGCKDGECVQPLSDTVNECEKLVLSACAPKYLYTVLPLFFEENGVRLGENGVLLSGGDISKHLNCCHSAVLMCATLGREIDLLLRRLQITDMAAAVAADALASAAIEQVCDEAEREIFTAVKATGRTWRFSPGYGDLPLDVQPLLLNILSAQKKIGLAVTDSNMMTPTKSVTALIGLSDSEIKGAARSCEGCNMKDKCNFRKSGGHCGT